MAAQRVPAVAEVARCESLAAMLTPQDASVTAARFAAMGHPRRIQLMNLLVRSGFPVCVCDLVSVTGWPQSTVSHHLKKLVDAGLLYRQQRGNWACYSVDRAGLAQLADLVTI